MGTNITGIGNANAIGFKSRVTGGAYFPPELKDALVGVWSAYGKSNDSTDRNIIKNKIKDRGGDFVISNAAFKLNSGFGKYEVDFTSWIQTNGVIASSDKVQNSIIGRFLYFNTVNKKEDISSFKVNITLGQQGKLQYNYIKEDGTSTYIVYSESGIYTIPTSYFSKYTGGNAWFGFYQIEGTSIIEQIPSFEGAFVTDGINDLITSTKTVQEMLGGSNEITVVSMMANLDSRQILCNSNFSNTNGYNVRNTLEPNGVITMLGYTDKNGTTNNLNLIMGDKNSIKLVDKVNFNSDYVFYPAQYYKGYYQVAWYWTIIANKVLTTDEINQVIAYYNLDRTLKADILCNIEKQGITNENHAEFGDKLIDFSGNGRDIQLNNIAWDGNSGIGKYNYPNWKVTATIANTYSTIVNYPTVNGTYSINVNGVSELMQSIGLHLEIKYTTSTGIIYNDIKQDGVYSYILPDGATDLTLRFGGIPGIVNEPCNITITQIPSHAGALYLDGVNDFGQFVGDLGLKDYTFIADRAYDRIVLEQAPFIASTQTNGQAPFLMEYLNKDTYVYPHSFGTTTKTTNLNIQRQISYQSTYVYNGNSISKGTSVDTGDGLTIGNSGSTGLQYSPLCLWSLMLFPYSMSEFLIERQLKKHKLGTLYPNMVEFRPVIKSSVELVNKPTFVIRDTSTLLNAGDYIPENSEIWMVITMNNAADRITKFVINGNTIDIPSSAYDPSTMKYGFPFIIDSKSPQKITMTIEQDENYVLFNPVITSNVEYVRLDFYLNDYQKRINIGDYIPKDVYLRANLYLKNNVDELTVFTFNGVNIGYRRSSFDNTAFNIEQIYNYDSPQEVNITIDEYIRYEDIVQPYPVLLRFNDENGNEVSWGGKFRVGSTITRIGSISDPESNLLNGLYSVSGLSLNGKAVTSSTSIVEKQMVFRTTATWLLDNNEPKVILSPRLLSIPNSSYKILGYIPDISGHGNNGVIHNSAYTQMSGANGYGTNLANWSINSANTGKIITQREEHLEYEVLSADKNILFYNTKIKNDTFIIYTSVNTNIVYSKESDIIANIPANTPTKVVCPKIGTILLKTNETPTVGNIITVKQYGIYEGAYCFDGVNDFVTIPTTVGGKQVLMKVNWQSIAGTAILYDQRTNGGFAIFNEDFDTNKNKVLAYRARNIGGSTYIDGILNEYIYASELKDITHNIVELCDPKWNIGTINPKIGSSFLNTNYTQMSLYDFMLFDEISTDDKIKELNEYVGVEAKVELPPYYWDAYGKTNLDADKATIQQRGVAVGDYDITNYNHAYDKMSGYGGYEFAKFDNELNWYLTPNNNHIDVVSRNGYEITLKNLSTSVNGWHFQNSRVIGFITRDIPFKVRANKSIRVYWDMNSYKISSEEFFGHVISITTLNPNEDTSINLRHLTEEELAELDANKDRMYYLLWFDLSTLAVNEEVTIEMLPLYPNGLVYDAVTDYSKNSNIPALDDFTAIMKRKWLKKQGCPLIKGSKVYEGGNGNALLFEWDKAYNFVFYKRTDIIEGELPDNISFITPTNYNGNVITRGSEQDTNGICIAGDGNAGFANMVFYKLILYPKTIPLLQINFLKNLMEKDEIIDLNNPIFIKNE